MCGLYAIAVWTSPRGFAVGVAALVVLNTVSLAVPPRQLQDTGLFTIVPIVAMLLLRSAVRGRQLRAEALAARAELLERHASGAVLEERARIARELHDLVAHNVSVMVVQAAAARRMIDHDASKAKEALGSVEQTGRAALKEMRRMVGMLGNDPEEPLALAPQPSVDELDWLVERAREAGLDVDLTIEGEKRRLESGVDLSAFRIVQEALRNTLQHAGPARARVTIRYGEHDVEVDVSDNGRGVAAQTANGAVTGQGLVGMRERVAMLGGEIEAGYRKDGGFGVHAKLPLEREEH